MNIKYLDSKEDRIKINTTRLRIELLTTKIRLIFIDKVIKMSEDKVSTRLLSVWCKDKRSVSRLNTTIKHSLINYTFKKHPIVNKYKNLELLTHITCDSLTWEMLIKKLIREEFFLKIGTQTSITLSHLHYLFSK